ncbi:hypothetical protein FGB62_211g016 [Gracilaria domingensis]|nr:hypothetical protein FGB62_211g016 [Gracilaria domingensis]
MLLLPAAFVQGAAVSLLQTRHPPAYRSRSHRPERHSAKKAPRRRTQMQIPPPGHEQPPLSELEKGPPGYKWNPDYPGTMKPGLEPDNYPLEDVMTSGVYERMEYTEMDIDERDPRVFEPDEDLLEWLAKHGRLIPRGASDDEIETEAERQISGITEEDLDFGDDDSRMIAYYSRQGEGSASGAGQDFGGFSESSGDAGFDL